MRTTIKFKNGAADIEIGNSDISGKYVTSPNGRYFMICDTLYTPSGNDKEYAFVFTKDEVCYKKLIPNEAAGESFYVFDDGQSLILTDESTLIRLDVTGKQISKRTVPELDENGIIGSVFYGIGYDDDGLTFLYLYDLESGRVVTRTIPDIEYDDDDTEDLLSSDVEWSIIGEKFVFVYANGIDAVTLDLHGNPMGSLECDIEAVNDKRAKKEEAQQIERQQRAISQYQYWVKRLESDKASGKDTAEIERAESEIMKYKERLPEGYIDNNKTSRPNSTTQQPSIELKSELTKPNERKKIPTWIIILIAAILFLMLIGRCVNIQ